VLFILMIVGINSVVMSLNLKEGDAILINQFTYGAVKNICYYLAQQRGKTL